MQIFLRILKETGIAIIILMLVALVMWLLFNKHLPFLGQDIPDAIDYAEISESDFSTQGKIEDETNPTQTYEVTNEQLNGYVEDRYVSTGLPNPFNGNNAEPDVPSERVTISNPTVIGPDGTIPTQEAESSSGVASEEKTESEDSGVKSLE